MAQQNPKTPVNGRQQKDGAYGKQGEKKVQASMKTAIVKAVLIHLVLVAIFVVGADLEFLERDPRAQPMAPDVEIVQATAVDESRVEEAAQRIRDQRESERRAEEERVAELERRAQQAEQQRQREAEQARQQREQAQREREQAEAEARRLREQNEAEERRAAEAAEQRRQEEAAAEERRRQQEEQRRQEEERRQQEEAERQRREQEEAERAARERQIQENLEAERQQRDRARQQQVMSEVERYQALIRQTIQRNLRVDSSMRGQSCVLEISMARTGFVTNVEIVDGDRAVCEAGRSATLRAGTLPVSDDANVYQELSQFRLRIEPEFN